MSHLQRRQHGPISSTGRDRAPVFPPYFDHTDQFVLILQPDGMIAEVNQAVLNFCGLPRAELVNRPLWRLAPEAEAQLQDGVRRAVNGRLFRAEIELARENGQTRPGKPAGSWLRGATSPISRRRRPGWKKARRSSLKRSGKYTWAKSNPAAIPAKRPALYAPPMSP